VIDLKGAAGKPTGWGDRGDDHVGVLGAEGRPAEAAARPDLGVPADFLHGFGSPSIRFWMWAEILAG
jgi:hypothetical protein